MVNIRGEGGGERGRNPNEYHFNVEANLDPTSDLKPNPTTNLGDILFEFQHCTKPTYICIIFVMSPQVVGTCRNCNRDARPIFLGLKSEQILYWDFLETIPIFKIT